MSYRLRDFGSYTAGGRMLHVTEGEPREVRFTRTSAFIVDPRGHFAVEHCYVQYFVPEARNTAPPVVLVHGGGMSGACWETTPDGRPGWLHLLLKRGYEVHVMDAVERGRAGFVPGLWAGDPLLRSMEEAWTLFRFGAPEGFETRTAFPEQRFPCAALETFARGFVPRWLGTSALQVDALLQVLEKTGPAIVIAHSQGGELVFDALARAPQTIAQIIALEPSGYPNDHTAFGDTPVALVTGDYLDSAPFWIERQQGWTHLTRAGSSVKRIDSTALGGGNSHMLMMDDNSERILDAVLAL